MYRISYVIISSFKLLYKFVLKNKNKRIQVKVGAVYVLLLAHVAVCHGVTLETTKIRNFLTVTLSFCSVHLPTETTKSIIMD